MATNISTMIDEYWLNEFQMGNKGAALFIITYIGFYGLSIIVLFGQQLKQTQRQRQELPAYFLKTLWDVPNKNKLYRLYRSVQEKTEPGKCSIVVLEELADVERLKRIFRAYFTDHETYLSVDHQDLQSLVEERAEACALKYREKLRRLHLSHTDYYLDTIQRLADPISSEKFPIDDSFHQPMLAISVV